MRSGQVMGLMARNQLSRLMILMFYSKFMTGVELQVVLLLMLMLILKIGCRYIAMSKNW